MKLASGGYDVECYVRQMTQDECHKVVFQKKFETRASLLTRVDELERTADGETSRHEIKSSKSVKYNDHIADACFQKIFTERAGQKIDRVSLVHLSSVYVRQD